MSHRRSSLITATGRVSSRRAIGLASKKGGITIEICEIRVCIGQDLSRTGLVHIEVAEDSIVLEIAAMPLGGHADGVIVDLIKVLARVDLAGQA